MESPLYAVIRRKGSAREMTASEGGVDKHNNNSNSNDAKSTFSYSLRHEMLVVQL